MNDPYHQSSRWERASQDPYLNAACWERAWEQKQSALSSLYSQRSPHLQLDEAGWALLERRISDAALFRRCGQVLLRLLTFQRGAPTGATTPCAAVTGRPAGSTRRGS